MSITPAKEIILPKNTISSAPLYLRGSEPVKIIAEENAQALVIELYLDGDPQAETEIILGQNANIQHAALILNGKLNLTAILHDCGAQFSSQILMLPQTNQHVEVMVEIHHISPDGQSTVLARAAVDDEAKSAFTGKIIVDKIASNTAAQLESKNLLLSDKATATSRPEFEIDNGDIRCAHGATIGHLDNDALFYLSSRGISINDARHLLIAAFLQPVMQHFAHLHIPQLQQYAHEYQ